MVCSSFIISDKPNPWPLASLHNLQKLPMKTQTGREMRHMCEDMGQEDYNEWGINKTLWNLLVSNPI